MYYRNVPFDALEGKILTEVIERNDELYFVTDNGEEYKMYHSQDCCESVSIQDITGDLHDLIGHPILTAEERTEDDEEYQDLGMWTFYEVATIKGSVTICWYGTSNGYYSVSVSFERTK